MDSTVILGQNKNSSTECKLVRVFFCSNKKGEKSIKQEVEKIESAARNRALAFANQKNADALRTFMDDEEMWKAIHAVQGGFHADSD